jgi:SAM-dependent methyltransferase
MNTQSNNTVVGRDCLYCGGNNYERLMERIEDRLGYVKGSWEFWRCRDCGSAMLAPFPKPSDLASFYPSVYSFAVERSGHSPLQRLLARMEYYCFYERQYEAQAKRVLRITGQIGAGKNLLDVGCGQGLRLLAFQRRGFKVQGMDFQPEAVEHVKTQLRIPAVCTDAERLRECFPPGSFDLVTSFHMLEHITDATSLVRNIETLLRPGGWMVLGVPFIDSLQSRLLGRHWMVLTEAPRHVSIPTQQAMVRLCQKAGFNDVRVVPDSIFMCAGVVGLSLVPGSATTFMYHGKSLKTFGTRFLGALATALALPCCWMENHLWRQPCIGLVFARKPANTTERPL